MNLILHTVKMTRVTLINPPYLVIDLVYKRLDRRRLECACRQIVALPPPLDLMCK